MSVEDELVSRLKLENNASKDQKDRTTSFLDNPDITVKIADLGNACWTVNTLLVSSLHFTSSLSSFHSCLTLLSFWLM